MMERYDVVVRHLLILFIEGLDEVDVFRDRGDDDDVGSGEVLFMEPFAEQLRIELQRLFDQPFRQWIGLDEIVGLVPVLDDAVIFVHLLERTHS